MHNFVQKNAALAYDDIQIVPAYSDISSRSDVNVDSVLDSKRNIVLRCPIIASPMDTVCGERMVIEIGSRGGLGIIHRFMSPGDQARKVVNALSAFTPYVGFSVGVKGSEQKRLMKVMTEVRQLIQPKIGALHWDDKLDKLVISIDIAHAHCKAMQKMIRFVKSQYPNIHVMAGTVATKGGVADLTAWGADSVRVGVGNGSLCSTRINTGVGVPQVTALQECCASGATIIADGGVRTPGDVAKAMGLGATAVMLGSLLAGTKESPGETRREGQWPNETLTKVYRGAASLDSKLARGEEAKNVEGVSQTIKYKGKTKRIVSDITDGLRSAMSYVGAENIEEFQKKARFIQVTQAGVSEASTHGIQRNSFGG